MDSWDFDGNAALKKVSRVKIAGAELNYGWDELKIMFEKDCFDVYQPDATPRDRVDHARQELVLRTLNAAMQAFGIVSGRYRHRRLCENRARVDAVVGLAD